MADRDVERGLVKTSVGYIHYRASGSGDPLVLIHGQRRSSALYLELMEAVRGDFRTIAVDLPSCGSSDHVPGGLRMPDYARIIAEALEGIGVQPTYLLGHNAGGRVATHMALTFPDVVKKIVLANPAWWPTPEFGLKAITKPMSERGVVHTRTREEYLSLEPGHCPMDPPDSWVERVNQAMLESGTDSMQVGAGSLADDWRVTLPQLPCPALLLWGEHFIYTRNSGEFEGLLNNHEKAVIAGARFDPWIDQPSAVRAAIVRFLQPSRSSVGA